MLKEKLGIFLYEENYYEEEIIKTQNYIEEIDKASNEKLTKKLTEELIEESNNESDNEPDNESHKESNKESVNKSNKKSIKEIFEELSEESKEEFLKDLMEIKNLNNNKSKTDWFDKNKFNKILTTTDNNGFNHKNKVCKSKFNNINNLIIDIKNNTISEADT